MPLTPSATIRSMGRARAVLVVATGFLVSRCSGGPDSLTATVTVHVRQPGGAAVPGAQVRIGDTSCGATDPAGRCQRIVSGLVPDGVLRVWADCPDGYQRAAPERQVPLPPAPGPAAPPHPLRVDLVCAALTHRVALAVRTGDDALSGMPIRVDGEVRGHLGSGGVGHLLLRRPPGSEVRVSLDTSAFPERTPQHPVHVVMVPGEDVAAVVHQAFAVRSLPSPRRRRSTLRPPAATEPPRPRRIQ